MRRVLAGLPGASVATLLLALVLWFGLFLKADAASPFDVFQPQQPTGPSQQPNRRSEQSDAALFDLFRTQPSGAQRMDLSAYANDTNPPHVYRHHRYLRHARHHRHERSDEASASGASDSSVSSASPNAPLADSEPTWTIATAPVATQPEPSAVSTFQIVMITQDGGDPFDRCMAAYYWSRLNHALQADQMFDPAPRDIVDATSPDVTRHLAVSWIEKSAAPR
jgi:hypothetical protein